MSEKRKQVGKWGMELFRTASEWISEEALLELREEDPVGVISPVSEGKQDGPERKEGQILRLAEGLNSCVCLMTEIKNESKFHLKVFGKLPSVTWARLGVVANSPSNQACSFIVGKQTTNYEKSDELNGIH